MDLNIIGAIWQFKKNMKICNDLFIERLVKLDFYPWQCQQFLFKRDFIVSENILYLDIFIAEDIVFNTQAIIKSKTFTVLFGYLLNPSMTHVSFMPSPFGEIPS